MIAHRHSTIAKMVIFVLAIIGASVGLHGSPPTSAASAYLLLDPHGGKSGDLSIRRDGASLLISWQSKNNGRGTETIERLELDNEGIPVSWQIDTKSDLGTGGASSAGAKTTTFTRSNGKATWTIDGVTTTRPWTKGMIFVPKDASPWSLGLYARALLKQSTQQLTALPAGKLALARVGEKQLAGIELTAYRLDQPDSDSEILWLDANLELAAIGDGSLVIADHPELASALRDAARERDFANSAERQAKLLHNYDGPVRIGNVHIFNSRNGKVGPLASVVIERGKIIAIEAANARRATIEHFIDGEGGFLVPGLHDTHFHIGLAGAEGAWMSLAAGVTTARDMGSKNEYSQAYLRDARTGRLPAPRMILSGMIEGQSPYTLQSSGIVAANEQYAIAAVRYYAASGYAQIKLYNSVDYRWVPAVAREAHRLNLRVAGHIPAFSNADMMIEAGYDEMTHANQLMLGWVLNPGEDTRSPLRLTAMSRFASLDLQSAQVRHTLDLMQQHKTVFEPTLAIMERLVINRTGEVDPPSKWWFDNLPKPFRPGKMVVVLPGFTIMPIKTEADDLAYREAAHKMVELVRLMNKRGIFVIAGSDDNNGFVIRRELELFVEAGMTPAEVLKRVTFETANYLGHGNEWGVIEPGKSADFFLVPTDPTRDITALRGNRMTVSQGKIYFPSEIYTSLGIKPFGDRPTIVAPRLQ